MAAAQSPTTACLCVFSAIIPDADVLFGHHRTWTHSLGATLAFSMLIAAVARAARWPVARTAVACTLAYASHVFLDWLGMDTAPPEGVMVFWPVSRTYFKSGVDLFAEVSRRYWKPDEFLIGNLLAVLREVLILGPFAWLAHRWPRRAA